jgi:hypothetical protein
MVRIGSAILVCDGTDIDIVRGTRNAEEFTPSENVVSDEYDKEELLAVVRLFEDLKSDPTPLQAYITERQKLVREIMDHAYLLLVWEVEEEKVKYELRVKRMKELVLERRAMSAFIC